MPEENGGSTNTQENLKIHLHFHCAALPNGEGRNMLLSINGGKFRDFLSERSPGALPDGYGHGGLSELGEDLTRTQQTYALLLRLAYAHRERERPYIKHEHFERIQGWRRFVSNPGSRKTRFYEIMSNIREEFLERQKSGRRYAYSVTVEISPAKERSDIWEWLHAPGHADRSLHQVGERSAHKAAPTSTTPIHPVALNTLPSSTPTTTEALFEGQVATTQGAPLDSLLAQPSILQQPRATELPSTSHCFLTLDQYLDMISSTYWPNRHDVKCGRLYVHQEYAKAITEILGRRGLCAVVGSSGAGKTALTIGIAIDWILNADATRDRGNRTAYYHCALLGEDSSAGEQWFREIESRHGGQHLFIIDNCHAAPEAVRVLRDKWTNQTNRESAVLLVSRPSTRTMDDDADDDPITSLIDAGLAVQIKAENIFLGMAKALISAQRPAANMSINPQELSKDVWPQAGRESAILSAAEEEICKHNLAIAACLLSARIQDTEHAKANGEDPIEKVVWTKYRRIDRESGRLLSLLCCLREFEISVGREFLETFSKGQLDRITSEHLITEVSTGVRSEFHVDVHPSIAAVVLRASLKDSTVPLSTERLQRETVLRLKKYLLTSPLNHLNVYRVLETRHRRAIQRGLIIDQELQGIAIRQLPRMLIETVVLYLNRMGDECGVRTLQTVWQRYLKACAVDGVRLASLLGDAWHNSTPHNLAQLCYLLKRADPAAFAQFRLDVNSLRCRAIAIQASSLGGLLAISRLMQLCGRPSEDIASVYRGFFEAHAPNLLKANIQRLKARDVFELFGKCLNLGIEEHAMKLSESLGESGWNSLLRKARNWSGTGTGRIRSLRQRIFRREKSASDDLDLACTVMNNCDAARLTDELLHRTEASARTASTFAVCRVVQHAFNACSECSKLVEALFNGIASRDDLRSLLENLTGTVGFFLHHLDSPSSPAREKARAAAKSMLDDGSCVDWVQTRPLADAAAILYYGDAAEPEKMITFVDSMVASGYVGREFRNAILTPRLIVLFMWNVGLALGKPGLDVLAGVPLLAMTGKHSLRRIGQGQTLCLIELIGMSALIWGKVEPLLRMLPASMELYIGERESPSEREVYSRPFFGMRLAMGLQVLGIGRTCSSNPSRREPPEWYVKSLEGAADYMGGRGENAKNNLMLEAGYRALLSLSLDGHWN